MKNTSGPPKRGTKQVMQKEVLSDFRAALADVLSAKDEEHQYRDCPDDNILAAYVDGQLDEAGREELLAHLRRCTECKGIVADAVKAAQCECVKPAEGSASALSKSTRGTPSSLAKRFAFDDDLDELMVGARVGRYVLLHKLGAGAMAEVYAAYDPELDRKIALKLVHPELDTKDGGQGARSRLLREAQAMARLSHRNVVAVHDVEAFDNEIAIAMEFIDGQTLREWLNEDKRSWREVRDVFVQAGRGLAAAHKAGLVHRDFKPDNVLLGRDGRVCVTDFGLVRSAEGPWAESPPSVVTRSNEPKEPSKHSRSLLTRTGTLLGTPAYMAPEQLQGRSLDPRTDQYSFCVALYEALYGERPNQAKDFKELREKTLSGNLPSPPKGQVPSWLRTVVLRGLSKDPTDRFPSMAGLLVELTGDSRIRRRRARYSLATATCLVTITTAALMAHKTTTRCQVPPDVYSGVWDTTVQTRIERAFSLSGIPNSDQTARHFSSRLDAYVETWKTTLLEACKDARERGVVGEDELQRQVHCLNGLRESIRELTIRLRSQVTPAIAQQAVSAAFAVADPTSCRNGAYVPTDWSGSSDGPQNGHPTAIETKLRRIKVLANLGSHSEVVKLARPTAEECKQIRDSRCEAAALYWLGFGLDGTADYGAAVKSLKQSMDLAGHLGNRSLFAHAFAMHAIVLGVRLEKFDDALDLLNQIGANTLDIVGSEPAIRLQQARARGLILFAAGRNADAESYLREVVDIEALVGTYDSPQVAAALFNLGSNLLEQGRPRAALAILMRCVSVATQTVGSNHFLTGHASAALAAAYVRLGDPRAVFAAERALAILTAALGHRHPYVANALSRQGEALSARGDLQGAKERFLEALAIFSERGELATSYAMETTMGLAWVSLYKREWNAARLAFTRVLDQLTKITEVGRLRARAQFGLARSLGGLGVERSHALSLARTAECILLSQGGGSDSGELLEIREWISASTLANDSEGNPTERLSLADC